MKEREQCKFRSQGMKKINESQTISKKERKNKKKERKNKKKEGKNKMRDRKKE